MKDKKSSSVPRSFLLLLALLTAFGAARATAAGGRPNGGQGQVPTQTQAAPAPMAQSPSVCGNQPLCSETADFAATITDFRTSTQGGWKLIDVVVRFLDKTSQPIILGYVNGSLQATDDQGNRYGMAGNGQGVRGIGVINGNSLDPKFVVQSGGAGDTRFELAWLPSQGVIQGSTFELYLTIREASPVQGGQYILGGEFPLHYQGLANGVSGAVSPANSSGSGLAGMGTPAGMGTAVAGATSGSSAPPGCVPIGQGAQNTATTVANTTNAVGGGNPQAAGATSQISSAISGVGSLFGRKKAAATQSAPAAAQNTTGASPCPSGYTLASNVGNGAPQVAGGPSSLAAATGAPLAASGTALVSNPCAGRQYCYNAGPFTAEVQLAAANQRAGVAIVLRNVTNQPIFLAYRGTTSQLRDNLGHALALQQDPSAYQRPSRLLPGQAMPMNFAFNSGQNPLGTSFTYGVVIDQFQVPQTGQASLLREYPLSFSGLAGPGAATAQPVRRAATATAAKKP